METEDYIFLLGTGVGRVIKCSSILAFLNSVTPSTKLAHCLG